MGIILAPLYLLYIFVIVGLALFSLNKTKRKINAAMILFVGFMIPGWDIVMTHLLGIYYCKVEPPHPKTYIEKIVEFPESIYWEDNVYPGFSEEDRKLMIMNYLDGIHLKTMALNGDDGKVYVYEATEDDYKNFTFDPKYNNRYEQYVSIIAKKVKIHNKSSMPKMNYTVNFMAKDLSSFQKQFIYIDTVKVIDNSTRKVVAYNQRVMARPYWAFPANIGGLYYQNGALCGEEYPIDLRLFKYIEKIANGKVKVSKIVRRGNVRHKVVVQKHLFNKYEK